MSGGSTVDGQPPTRRAGSHPIGCLEDVHQAYGGPPSSRADGHPSGGWRPGSAPSRRPAGHPTGGEAATLQIGGRSNGPYIRWTGGHSAAVERPYTEGLAATDLMDRLSSSVSCGVMNFTSDSLADPGGREQSDPKAQKSPAQKHSPKIPERTIISFAPPPKKKTKTHGEVP